MTRNPCRLLGKISRPWQDSLASASEGSWPSEGLDLGDLPIDHHSNFATDPLDEFPFCSLCHGPDFFYFIHSTSVIRPSGYRANVTHSKSLYPKIRLDIRPKIWYVLPWQSTSPEKTPIFSILLSKASAVLHQQELGPQFTDGPTQTKYGACG